MSTKKVLALFLSIILIVSLIGCAGAPATTTPPTTTAPTTAAPTTAAPTEPKLNGEVLISAAASLTDCLSEMGKKYNENQPGVTVTFNFGSSGALQQQIEQGAPADIFFSAAARQMNALKDGGLMLNDTITDLIVNEIALVVPKGNSKITFSDLGADGIKSIAIGDPGSVPAGQYATEIFAHLGIDAAVESKLILGKDVRQVLTYAEEGEVDAGIVFKTDALVSEKIELCETAPAGSHTKAVYPVGIVKDSKNVDLAKDFIAFLNSADGIATFEKYGFSMNK